MPRSVLIRVNPAKRTSRTNRRRWLIITGMAALALVLAAAAMIDESDPSDSPPVARTQAGTKVIALKLPTSRDTLSLGEAPGRTRPSNVAASAAVSDPFASALPGSGSGAEASVEQHTAAATSAVESTPAVERSTSADAPSDSQSDAVSVAAAQSPTESSSIAGGESEANTPAQVEEPSLGDPAHRVTVRRGDSLYLIFKRLGLPQRDLALMTSSKSLARKLARLAPGQEIEFYLDSDSRLTRLVHRLDGIRSVRITRNGDKFAFEEIVEPPEVSAASAEGTIDSSLFLAGQRAGLSHNIIMQMAEIFAWDVDFALDIRVGDRFALIFEEQFKDGKKVGEGPIIAAEFTNRGRRVRALRYEYPSGHAEYFSPDGRSMRKQFLRSPVNFTRISSRFNLKRRHPILHKIRAHRGVDYAARRGTAVNAAGDGKVIFAKRNGGYGRTVILQHGKTYSTLYAHLDRFAKGIRPGKRVVQGQTIGYVGSTGLATGPHLHYEFRVRGVHRDPLRIELPDAPPLADEYMGDFLAKAQPLLANLDLIGGTSVATAEQTTE